VSPSRATVILPGPLRGLRVVSVRRPPVAADESDSVADSSRKAGYAEAEELYTKMIHEGREEMLHMQQELFTRLQHNFRQMQETVHERLPGLVMSLVREVIGGIGLDGASVRGLVDKALNELSVPGGGVTIRLSPKDAKLLEGLDKDIHERYRPVVVLEDADLKPGDCLVESRFGTIDGRLETKLRKLAEEVDG